jgi:hypothetical protein
MLQVFQLSVVFWIWSNTIALAGGVGSEAGAGAAAGAAFEGEAEGDAVPDDGEADEPPLLEAGAGEGSTAGAFAFALGWKLEGRPPHPTNARAAMDRTMAGGTRDFIVHQLRGGLLM